MIQPHADKVQETVCRRISPNVARSQYTHIPLHHQHLTTSCSRNPEDSHTETATWSIHRKKNYINIWRKARWKWLFQKITLQDS